jgi:tetratricopeptide (TPR) repeat protein
MKSYQPTRWPAAVLLVACMSGSVLALRAVDQVRGKQATLEDMLYVRSGKSLKRMSLGYSGLLADIYWTRAVQYFGTKHSQEAVRYDLLYPLLDITTDLDPHLIVAYEFGSIFLSQAPPAGAGQPDKAAELVEKGIRANPDHWRLYFTLGYIHYFDRKDYKAAQLAFQKGSEVPGALSWMKVMAATMAQHAGETGTSIAIWRHIYDSTEDDGIRQNAVQHLVALQVDADVTELEHRIEVYRENMKHAPTGWQDLIQAGLLNRVPRDPNKMPYVLIPDGTVQVQDPAKLPFITKGLPPGWQQPGHTI